MIDLQQVYLNKIVIINALYCSKLILKLKRNHVNNVYDIIILDYLKLRTLKNQSEAFHFLSLFFEIFFLHLVNLETHKGDGVLSLIQQTIGLITNIPIAYMRHETQ